MMLNEKIARMKKSALRMLDQIAPGSQLVGITPFSGDYAGDHSNETFFVDYELSDRTRKRVAIKRYTIGDEHYANKSQVEFQVLSCLQGSEVPALRPILLDADGAIFDSPAIVTEFMPGQKVMFPDLPLDTLQWVGEIGEVLARIHAAPCEKIKRCLYDARGEALWFLHSGKMPEYVKADPFGEWVWSEIQERLPRLEPVRPALVHLDYWSGNLLWEKDIIKAVIDWEEASYGDPGIDVGYCLMDMYLIGVEQAAKEFLQVYEKSRGIRTANLGFWQLAAAVRPMVQPEGWISEPVARKRFRQFIEDALARESANAVGD